MKTILMLASMLVFISQLSYSAPSQNVPLAGQPIERLISEFKKIGEQLIEKGQAAGNALIASGGNELQIATQNVNYYFEKNRRETFDDLSPREQNLFVNLNKIITETNNMSVMPYDISELIDLDLRELTRNISLLDRSSQYYISSIKGKTFVYKESDYRIKIRGIGFGLDNSDNSYATEVYIGETKIEANNLDFTQRRTMFITIPNSLIKKHFKDDSIVYVPVKIKNNITTKGLWGTKTTAYVTDFNLTLMPIKAGTIVVTEKVRVEDQQNLTHTLMGNFEANKCTTKDPCFYQKSFRVPEYQAIDIVKIDTCEGQCSHFYPTYEYSADRRFVTINAKYDGKDNGVAFTFIIHYREFKEKVVEKVNKPIDLRYDQPVTVMLDTKNPDCNYSITGETFTKEKIDVNSHSIANSKHLKLLGVGKAAGAACVGQFELKSPVD